MDAIAAIRAIALYALAITESQPEPEEPQPEPEPEPTPEEPQPEPDPGPMPDPDPLPAPPVTGTHNAFGPAELVSLARAATGGEVIVAKAGYSYDGINLSGINPASPVTIAGEVPFGQMATIDRSSNLTLSLDFCLSAAPVLTKATPYFVRALATTRAIVLDGCTFHSRADADGYAAWDLATWQAWRMGGASLEGAGSAVRDCVGHGLNMGFAVAGPGSVIERNRLSGVSRDAIRLLGDDCAADDNTVQDMVYLGDGNHPDMLQMFTQSGDGQMRGLAVRRNTFRNSADIPTGSPLLAAAQGIGTYGSPKAGGGSIQTTLTGAIVEDNIVETASWNGIVLCIAADGSVCRNTVRDILGRTDGHAKFRIFGACANTQVRDNSAPRLNIAAAAAQSGNMVA